ncbi:hypothetical protein [Streptomyces sp. GS7]|uniref:hypothetical protein n=1 Tax=Streptomyces sp. GS7 TaxID=2692234 RepID=UPI0013167F40|nr:hypothetical protein [Streptomyces sp. GS7]QHC22250.1 hypothetical protein GR130_13240 [Streptomyces sp. GS7]
MLDEPLVVPTDRYVYLDGRGGSCAIRPGVWRDTPRDTSPTPLPIPSIAWWLHHLGASPPTPTVANRTVISTDPTGLATWGIAEVSPKGAMG